MISNDPSTRRLLQSKGVIALLIERLSDNEPDVINESTGSLRYFKSHYSSFEMTNKLILLETFVLMEVLTFVQKCITRI